MWNNLKNVPVILGSQSPRRKQLLADIGLDFTVEVRETDEEIIEGWDAEAVVNQIAVQKLLAFADVLPASLVICADTIVVSQSGEILGKPKNADEAKAVLKSLSGQQHQVKTAVAIGYLGKQLSFVANTDVVFYELLEQEIDYYIDKFKPFDKAGSYGIQEWIGTIGIKKIEGEYNNVVGLPTARLYQELKSMLN